MKRVEAGESIDVTEHGHPIARIVPLRPTAFDQLLLEGRATGASGDLMTLMDELGLPVPSVSSMLPSEALGQLRADER
jgi:antitoxin (DNA-binding transcriptional repressor) of toxin-antitoxin stability system